MKYVVLKVNDEGLERELPVLFPETMVHANVAKVLAAMLRAEQPRLRDVSVVSAGFFSCTELDGLHCHGESVSIGVKSRGPQDDKLLAMLDYSHGIV